MADVAAIILAAGRATRFGAGLGQTKVVAILDGRPLVRHVAAAALASRARPVLVVTGQAAEAVAAALAGLDCQLVHNPAYADGLSTSLKAGLGALPNDVDGAVILLADMPRVAAPLIDRLIDCLASARQKPGAVIPVHAGRRGNPVLIGRRLFPAVAAIEGDRGARALLDAAGGDVVECPVADEGIEIDVDTPDALRRLGQGGVAREG